MSFYKNPKVKLRFSRLGPWNLTLQGLRVLWERERRVKGEELRYSGKEDKYFYASLWLPSTSWDKAHIDSLWGGHPTLTAPLNAGEEGN